MLWTHEIDPRDPAPACAALVGAWRRPENRVFVLRAGGEIADPRAFYEALWPHLGRPVPIAEDVTAGDRDHQRTGEYWTAVRYDPRFTDAYRHSPNAQPLHTDGSYIPDYPNATLMVCHSSSAEGGETVFVAAQDVAEVVAGEDPALFRGLTERPLRHARSGDAQEEYVIREDGGRTLVNWNYYCVDREALNGRDGDVERFQQVLTDSDRLWERVIPVKLEPGDAVTWKDREVLHGRNAFKASVEGERFLWKCAIDIGAF